MSGAQATGENAESKSESSQLAEDDLEDPNTDLEASEALLEGKVSSDDLLEHKGPGRDFIYSGGGWRDFKDEHDIPDGNIAPVSPRKLHDGGRSSRKGNPMEPGDLRALIEEHALEKPAYIIDDSFAEILTYNNWQVEVRGEEAENEAAEYARSVAEVEEIGEVIVMNDLYDSRSQNSLDPVRLEYGGGKKGSEADLVPPSVMDRFVSVMSANGWDVEYSEGLEEGDRAMVYLSS